MKEGSVYQFSYAYAIDAARKPDESEKAADPNIKQVLEAVSLMEIAITPTPAQPLAEMVSVKSGRRNSKSDADKINQAISLLQDVLGELDDTETDDESENEPKANPAGEERTEAVEKRKSALLATINKYMTEEKS